MGEALRRRTLCLQGVLSCQPHETLGEVIDRIAREQVPHTPSDTLPTRGASLLMSSSSLLYPSGTCPIRDTVLRTQTSEHTPAFKEFPSRGGAGSRGGEKQTQPRQMLWRQSRCLPGLKSGQLPQNSNMHIPLIASTIILKKIAIASVYSLIKIESIAANIMIIVIALQI